MKRRPAGWVLTLAGLVYLLLHLPVLVLVVFSFNASKYSVSWAGFTFDWYRRLAERTDLLRGLQASLLVGSVSTLIATVFATLLAVALARRRFAGRRALENLLYLPIVTPEIVAGISLLVLFVLLKIPLGLGSITIAHIAFNIGFVAVVVRARLEGMDQSLEEAALVLGADEFTAFRTVTVPLLWPGILAGALLAFTMSFDDYVITSLVAGTGSSTLPIVVYSMVRRNVEPSVNAISTLILISTSLLIWLANRLMRERPLAAMRG
ncbi:MAG TPA: ABC transporter permease [Gemmatimonadales bacterium]|jgi:spermidine/putrescine transport system permease protein|nr:ABC transporter permease [Gemmatimonadales bacterium]